LSLELLTYTDAEPSPNRRVGWFSGHPKPLGWVLVGAVAVQLLSFPTQQYRKTKRENHLIQRSKTTNRR
jgi:hypothetical protein